nr:DUF2712 domain-containing protein [uncultured Mediterraneibacter sp.]
MKKRVLALLMVMAIGSSGVSVQAAGNVTDKPLPNKKISFDFSTAAKTNLEYKRDDTSHYIKNTSGFNLWVRSLSSTGANCTLRKHAIVQTGEWFIYNTVYEKGYSKCRLDITTAASGVSGNLKGYWSPDSVGSYPVANP